MADLENRLKLAKLKRQRQQETKATPELEATVAKEIVEQLRGRLLTLVTATNKASGELTKAVEHLDTKKELKEIRKALNGLESSIKEPVELKNPIHVEKVDLSKLKPPVIHTEKVELPKWLKDDVTFKEINSALDRLTTKLDTSQRPEDFVPYRRVIKRGNKFEFDDTSSGSYSGGGSSGGGSGGDASASNQTSGAQKTQIVDAGGDAATVTGGKLDVNASIDTTGLATSANQTTEQTRLGDVTETAPASDTASSALNGRLQRIAQRLTSLIALLPGSLGQKARTASLAVTLSTEDVTALTPPAAISGFATASNQTDRTQKTQITDGTDDLPIGAITAASGTTSTTGAILLAVSPGTLVRVFHISYVPTTAASADIDVSIEIGGTTINGWRTNFNGGGYMRSPKGGQGWWQGADGEDVTITLSAAQPVRWNLEYQIV